MSAWLKNLPSRSVAFRAMLLSVVALLVFAVTAPVAFSLGGFFSLCAAATSCMLCLVGALIALVVCNALRGPQLAMASLLAGMMARMGVPLCIGMAIHLHGGPLADAGLLRYFLVFYPVTLTVETALTLPLKPAMAPATSTSHPTTP
jgi:hypothetical protein